MALPVLSPAYNGLATASSPLTTRGDIWGFSSVGQRIPVGTDGYSLVADSSQDLGVRWTDAPTFAQYEVFLTVGSSHADYLTGGYSNFQSAVNAAIVAANSSGSGVVYIKYGSYTATGPIIPYSNVKITAAPGTTITLSSGANTNLIRANAAGGYQNIEIDNLILDGNASNQSSAGTGNALVYITGSDTLLKNVNIHNNTVKNSYKHAIFLTGDNTTNRYPKWISENYVENHGPTQIGYGIYVDYCRNTTVIRNTIKTSNGNDAIEMGHQGEIYTINNYVYDGQIQFPFASDSVIAHNIVKGNTIQNDANAADNVIIYGNQVLNATPASGFGGIRVFGSNAQIFGNRVRVTAYSGIAVYGDYAAIYGNNIDGTDASTGGTNGVYADRANNANIHGNVISNFSKGVQLVYDYNQVYGNTFLSCTTGIDLSDSSSSGHIMVGTEIGTNDYSGATTQVNLNNQRAYHNVGTIPTIVNGGLTNASSRPAVSSTRIKGEIGGFSSGGLANDDGFLRLSAGGGTNGGTKSFIDLSGFSNVSDMNENIVFGTKNAERMRLISTGQFGIGQSVPTAMLHLKAGTAAASTAPLKFATGVNLTTPEDGAVEFDGSNLYITIGGVRRTFTVT